MLIHVRRLLNVVVSGRGEFARIEPFAPFMRASHKLDRARHVNVVDGNPERAILNANTEFTIYYGMSHNTPEVFYCQILLIVSDL